MATTDDSKANQGGNAEKRAQTIMIGVIMLLVGWSFKATIESGQDIAAIKVQLNDLQGVKSSLQPAVNQLSLDNNKLRLDVDNTIQRLNFLELQKR